MHLSVGHNKDWNKTRQFIIKLEYNMAWIYSTHRENITESDNIQNMGVKNAIYLKYVKSQICHLRG